MSDDALSPCGPVNPSQETLRLAALRAFSIVDTPREIEFDRLVKAALRRGLRADGRLRGGAGGRVDHRRGRHRHHALGL